MNFINEENGVQAVVTKINSGYSVAVQDIDSGDYVDSVIICKTEDQAIAKAKQIVKF